MQAKIPKTIEYLGIDNKDIVCVRELYCFLREHDFKALEPFFNYLFAPSGILQFDLDENDIVQIQEIQNAFYQNICALSFDDKSLEGFKLLIEKYIQLGVKLDWYNYIFQKYQFVLMNDVLPNFCADSEKRTQLMGTLVKVIYFYLSMITQHYDNVSHVNSNEPKDVPSVHTNASFFKQSIEENISDDEMTPTQMAVLILSIENYGLLDSSLRINEIEALFSKVLARLNSILREKDIVVKLGLDKIGIILPGILSEGHVALAINKINQAIGEPFMANACDIQVDTRFGVSFYSDHEPVDADEFIKQANMALMQAQKTSSDYAFYSEDVEQQHQRHTRILDQLSTAIDENNFMMMLQPQYDLGLNRLKSAECLIRWKDNTGQYVSPEEFIPIAEQNGMMMSITSWIVNASLRYASILKKNDIDLQLGINISTYNLREKEFPEFIEQALRTWNILAEDVVLEITESEVMKDPETSLETLFKLKSLGVQLAIDDFGTGYSSLSYLKQLPVDELKIDKSFVMNMLSDEGDERIVRSVIDLAHNFDLRVVAEGVEDQETMEYLAKLGCDKIQGYFYSKPLAEDMFKDFCHQNLHPL